MINAPNTTPCSAITPSTQAATGDLILRFLEHVRVSPDTPAVLIRDFSLSYQALYLNVLHWKQQFEQLPAGSVVVCLERTPRLIAVLLALQWLGIPYIPIDLSLPIERLRLILTDSQATAILYDSRAELEQAELPALTLNLNHLSADVSNSKHQEPICCDRSAHAIAYIIYTSGSTGTPKGVAISRQALNNFLMSMSQYFLHGEHELLLATTTLAFDIAGLEVYLPLWQKKSIFLANQREHQDPFALLQLLEKYPVTLMQATPSLWKMLLSIGFSNAAQLVALCGGEALSQTLADTLLTHVGQLWNMYGPTEATIWCALKQIRAQEPISIGHPIDNMQMWVMNAAADQILKPGLKGELFIAGIGLAEGYVNNHALTQSQFLVRPDVLGGRLYRVGDIACSTPQGEIIIFGRTDNQVKLHGYRIELEEIEAQLQKIPQIRDCAVAVHAQQLVAYVCLHHPLPDAEQILIARLKSTLPSYMLPNRVLILTALPLNASGKINRRALPPPPAVVPSQSAPLSDANDTRTPTEAALLKIWMQALSLPQIGLQDNFFHLGGHSLIAARIIYQIDQHFKKHISLQQFYEAAHITALAQLLTQIPCTPCASPPADNLSPANKAGWVPLSDFQLMFWCSRLVESSLKNLAVVGRRRIQGPLNIEGLNVALQAVYQKHEAFSYVINPFYPAQKRKTPRSIRWLSTALLHQPTDSIETLLQQSVEQLYRHTRWSTLTATIIAKLFYLDHDQVELQVAISHLFADATSIEIFFKDLSDAYQAYIEQRLYSVQALGDLFQLYALKQYDLLNHHASNDVLFWKNYLQDVGLLPCPTQYMRDDHQGSFSSYLAIPTQVLSDLKGFCTTNQVTLAHVLCAAVGQALQICCQHLVTLPAQLFMNVVTSTRDNPVYDQIIGCFLATRPIKLDFTHPHTLLSFAQQAQQSSLETEAHQHAPSLVKLAAIGNLPHRQARFKKFLLKTLLALCAKKIKKLYVHPCILDACKSLFFRKRNRHFLVNINILPDFMNPAHAAHAPKLFNGKCRPIPMHQHDIFFVNHVLDLCFLHDPHTATHFLVISANLAPVFREKLAETVLQVLQVASIDSLTGSLHSAAIDPAAAVVEK